MPFLHQLCKVLIDATNFCLPSFPRICPQPPSSGGRGVGGGSAAAADSAEIGPAPQQVHAQLEQDRRIAASVSMLDRALSRADGEQPVMPAKRKAES